MKSALTEGVTDYKPQLRSRTHRFLSPDFGLVIFLERGLAGSLDIYIHSTTQ
jgi:hypothetical protein